MNDQDDAGLSKRIAAAKRLREFADAIESGQVELLKYSAGPAEPSEFPCSATPPMEVTITYKIASCADPTT